MLKFMKIVILTKIIIITAFDGDRIREIVPQYYINIA